MWPVPRSPSESLRRFFVIIAALAAVAGVLAVAFVGRTGPAPGGPRPASDSVPGGVPGPAAPAVTPSAAAAVVAAADGVAASGRWWLGAAVLDRETGEIVSGAHGGEPDYLASESKLLIVIDVLEQRRAAKIVLTDRDTTAIREALSASSDEAMDYLWDAYDGMGAVGRMTPVLGLTDTTPTRDPAQWAEVMSSAVDVARMWRYVLVGLPADDRELVLSAAAASKVPAADGFDQQFGLFDESIPAAVAQQARAADGKVADPAGGGAVAKQGWMCCFRNQFTLDSAGLPYADSRYVVVLLTRQPMTGDWPAASARVTAAALGAVRAMGPGAGSSVH